MGVWNSTIGNQSVITRHDNQDHQESVLDKDLVTAPGSPSEGDRYIIAGIGGAWSPGAINNIAEFRNGDWLFIILNAGADTYVEDENDKYVFSGTVWASASSTFDHGLLMGLGDDDHTQYHNDARALIWLGTRSTSDLPEGTNLYYTESRVNANTNVAANTTHRTSDGSDHTFIDQSVISGASPTLDGTNFTGIDHGSGLIGLLDDDHTQYHNDTRGDARYYTKTLLDSGQLDTRYFTEAEHINASAGVGDAGKPIKLDVAGVLANSFVSQSSVLQHESAITHGNISGVGTNSHATIDTHLADVTIHFTEASITHGNIGSLSADDHTQYALLSGRAGSTSIDGSPVTGENLVLHSNAFKNGLIGFGDNSVYDEANDVWVIGNTISLDNNVQLNVRRNDTTNTPNVRIDNQGTGDVGLSFAITGATVFTMGIDNSDDDKFKIARAGVLGTSADIFTIAAQGLVGVGTTTPAERFHVATIVDGDAVLAIFENAQSNSAASINETVQLRFGFGGDVNVARVVVGKEGDYTSGANRNSFMAFFTDRLGIATEVMRLSSNDNIGFSVTSFPASATKSIVMNNGVAPTGDVADQFTFYSADQTAGNAAPHFRTELGDVIKLYKISTGWSITNLTTDRVYDANATTLDEIADVLGTLIEDLKNSGLIAA